MNYSTPGFPVLHYLLEFGQNHVHCQWCHPTVSSCHPLLLLPSIFPSIRVFSNESVLHNRWPEYWSFSISISLSNEYSGLTSFRIDWLDLLAVQGAVKNSPTLQFKSINSLALSLLYVALVVKNLLPMQELQVQFLGWEDPLEEGMATHSSIVAWRIHTDRRTSCITVHSVTKSWTQLKQFSTISLLYGPTLTSIYDY